MGITKKMIALLLVLCVLVSMVPVAGAVDGEYDIAYASVQGSTVSVRLTAENSCSLFVAQYAEDGRLLDVRSAPVPYEWDYQTVTVPLQETGQDYHLQVFLLDSVTHAPLCDSYMVKNAGTMANRYAVVGLDMEKKTVTATVSTEEACTLEVQIWDVDESILIATATAEAEADLNFGQISAECRFTKPEYMNIPKYFVMYAVLKDAEGKSLSNPYINRRNTSWFMEFANQTEEDFRNRNDVTFLEVGESNDGNFMALNGNVTYLSCSASANTFVGEKDGVLTFRNATTALTGLKTDDCFAFMNHEGEYETVKIKEITVHNGTVSITRDEAATLSDFYAVVKINADLIYGEAEEETEVMLLGDDTAKGKDQLLKVTFGSAMKTNVDLGIVSVEGSVRAGGKVSINYDPKLLGENYMDVTVVAGVKGALDVTVGLAKNWKDDKELCSIPLAGVEEVLGASVNLELVCEIDCEVGYNFTLEFENYYGLTYSTDTSLQVLRKDHTTQKNASSESKVKGEIELEVGVRGELSVSLLDELVEASVGAEGGLAISAELDVLSGTLPSGLDSYHACDLCIHGDCKTYFEVDVTLDYEINAWLKGNLIDLDIVRVEATLGSFYLSLFNEADSVHGGEVAFDWADSCPNKKYQITFRTLNEEGTEVTGCTVAVLNKNNKSDTLTSPGSIYLYPGTYTAKTMIGLNNAEESFTVKDGIMTVYLNGMNKIVSGQVTNLHNGEVLSDATVQVNQDGVAIYSTPVDAQGLYTLSLPDGEYTVAFMAEGYETQVKKLTLTKDMAMDGKLQSIPYYIHFDANGGSGTMSDQMFRYGQTVTLPACSFEPPEGKVFRGWLIGDVICDAGTAYQPGAGNYTVAAVWQERTGMIKGTITAETTENSPQFTGAEVKLYRDGTLVESTRTGADGTYAIADLSPGSYSVRVFADGFGTAVGTVTIQPDSTVVYDAVLKPALDGGKCGTGVYWSLSQDGTLLIYGTGNMNSYGTNGGSDTPPWRQYFQQIQTIVVESGVTSVGSYAFGRDHWSDDVFCTVSKLELPEGLKTIGSYAFRACDNLTEVTIPSTVTQLNNYYGQYPSFADCKNITTVTFAEGATVCDGFEYCENLANVNLPDSITTIKGSAFVGCEKLVEIRLPKQLSTMSCGLSYTGITSIDLTKTAVTELDNGAFGGCYSLTRLVIPVTVTSINAFVFRGINASQVTIYYQGTEEQWKSVAPSEDEGWPSWDDYFYKAAVVFNYKD